MNGHTVGGGGREEKGGTRRMGRGKEELLKITFV